MLCTNPVSKSTPMCAFIPKYHWFPFFVWRICGSRSRRLFFLDEGAAMILASMIVPRRSQRPRCALISSNGPEPGICRHNTGIARSSVSWRASSNPSPGIAASRDEYQFLAVRNFF